MSQLYCDPNNMNHGTYIDIPKPSKHSSLSFFQQVVAAIVVTLAVVVMLFDSLASKHG